MQFGIFKNICLENHLKAIKNFTKIPCISIAIIFFYNFEYSMLNSRRNFKFEFQ